MTGSEHDRFQAGDVVLLSFPFADSSANRQRPALALLDTGDEDLVVARITSRHLRTPFDVQILAWEEAGLLLPSVIRLDKVATLEKSLIQRRLGRLEPEDWARVRTVLQGLWGTI